MKKNSLFLLSLFFASALYSQTYTLNWASSFSPAWVNGHTSGTASNIGASALNATVTVTKSGGIYDHSDGATGIATPTVSGSAFIVGGSSANIEIAMDFDASSEYTDIVCQFSAPVTHATFEIGDIDKPSSTDQGYLDEVVITGTYGAVTHLPTITKYDAVADPNFLVISGNTANASPTSGHGGNSASTSGDQKGTVVVNFGTNMVSTITIRYKNATGAASNPPAQGIAIGNMSFQRATPIPVTFTFIKAAAQTHQTVISWQTATEHNNSRFEIEKSLNGQSWQKIGTVPGKGNSAGLSDYSFNDPAIHTGDTYYRIRQVDLDGKSSYSTIVSIIRTHESFSADIYPIPLDASSLINLNSDRDDEVRLTLIDMLGRTIAADDWLVVKGNNKLLLPQFTKLGKGHYILHLQSSKTTHHKSIKLLKK